MKSIIKFTIAAAMAAVLCVGAAQAGDSEPYHFSYPNRDGVDDGARDVSVTGGEATNSNSNFGANISRSRALEYALPETNAQAGRVSVWDQPSMSRSGAVATPSMAAPYRDGYTNYSTHSGY